MWQFKQDLAEVQAAVEHRLFEGLQELLERFSGEKMEDFTEKEQQHKQQEEGGGAGMKMESCATEVAVLPELKVEVWRGTAPNMGFLTEEDFVVREIFPGGLYLCIIKLFGSLPGGNLIQVDWKKYRKKDGIGGSMNNTGKMILDWNE